jgi:hypothetical protein
VGHKSTIVRGMSVQVIHKKNVYVTLSLIQIFIICILSYEEKIKIFPGEVHY